MIDPAARLRAAVCSINDGMPFEDCVAAIDRELSYTEIIEAAQAMLKRYAPPWGITEQSERLRRALEKASDAPREE